ncbi:MULTISPECIES: hypothetical protein [unclassified Polaribacter]|uniref:hypothetical protein n=1 Tax=unclassified Polaribacter TaxID=196858 RepID=UPI0011BE481B|nr:MULTISPECIES: hypothetical protein [unclassified Polaribacter]TXD52966.1 hypothetical protein ES043_06230 [Polaribacter sp. IC063]TXD60942.1 hypothetical protein ES044_06235 [Polaribacter sp. IC066]
MPQITIRKIRYKNWNAIAVSNLEIKILVVPAIGRVLHYGFLAGENVFYENKELEGVQFKEGVYFQKDNSTQAPNIGGNRVLPCSEEYFDRITGSRHLPDPFINASAYSYSLLENGIVLESPISKLLGIQIQRIFTISETGTAVNIQQTLIKKTAAKNINLEEIPLTIWSLSKIKTPNFSYIPINPESVFENGFLISVWPDAENNAFKNVSVNNAILEIKSSKDLPQKVGSDSKNWIAGLIKKTLFVEKYTFTTDQKDQYPDGGTSCTIFGNNLFSELECLSPEKTLKIGETIQYDLQWSLQTVDKKSALRSVLQNL